MKINVYKLDKDGNFISKYSDEESEKLIEELEDAKYPVGTRLHMSKGMNPEGILPGKWCHFENTGVWWRVK